jgi:exodeoxyribonuclease VII large subunit
MGKGMLPFDRRGDGGEAGRDVTDEFVSGPAPLTVSELVGRIKEALLDAFGQRVIVVGEISNFKRHTSGHLYFSLKDPNATIDAVMFRPLAARVRFDVGDGLEVVAEGRVDVYEKQGRLQFYVERLTPRGAGALELAFRQLKAKLQAEGLFDPARKKPLPRFPRAVGVITSPTGAAIRDIARTLRRRWPAARVYLVGVHVQGDQAAGEIAEAVALLDAKADELGIDTLIVGRGGGSLEDLWAFNEEVVARAIFAARTPIISGVGHEVDFAISDFVADVRAATPTAAAELAVPDAAELRRHVGVLAGRLARRADERLATARAGLEAILRSVVFRDPASRIRSGRQHADELVSRMQIGLEACRRQGQTRLHDANARLIEQHPRRLLEPGRDAGVGPGVGAGRACQAGDRGPGGTCRPADRGPSPPPRAPGPSASGRPGAAVGRHELPGRAAARVYRHPPGRQRDRAQRRAGRAGGRAGDGADRRQGAVAGRGRRRQRARAPPARSRPGRRAAIRRSQRRCPTRRR